MKTVIVNIIVFFLFIGCSRKENEIVIIEKNVADLAEYMYQPENSEYYNNLNVEKVSKETADLIEKTINLEKTDISQIQGLSKNAELKNISIYSFGYDCGGTRGYITYPVIQWKNNNEPKAKDISLSMNFKVNQIVELNQSEELYLLIGHEKGDGSCQQSIAYVIKINENEIDLKYPAFIKRPYLNFCNGDFSYDQDEKILNFKMYKESNPEDLMNVFYYSYKYREFKNDTLSAKLLYEMIAENYYQNKQFNLKFDGKRFVAFE